MESAMIPRKLRLAVLALGLAISTCAGARSFARVQEWCGFSFAECTYWEIEHNAPPIDFGYGLWLDDYLFTLEYTDGNFVMTALYDNSYGESVLPSGLAVYPQHGALIPPFDSGSGAVGWIPNAYYPTVAGQQIRFNIPAVPEPASALLLLAGVACLALRRRPALTLRPDGSAHAVLVSVLALEVHAEATRPAQHHVQQVLQRRERRPLFRLDPHRLGRVFADQVFRLAHRARA
jgi:hypothetical protein